MSKKTVYEVFSIIEGKTSSTSDVKNVFIAKDYRNAILYFQGYIWDLKNYYDYRLYKVGKIDNTLKLVSCKVFITGGYEANRKTQEENRLAPLQMKILYDKVKDKLQDNVSDALQILFEGSVIDE